eukprot:Phypoly_transcript_10484.p1 GENE.Phypoly_transcript_10484~~Phypoly_transcript_10484.p1  ORF type:complete len:316 (+),score=20.39 Phypoly_transcript_10484:22-969(+)
MSLAKVGNNCMQWLAINAVGGASYVFTKLLNKCEVTNLPEFLKHIDEHYKTGRPIMTISNHSCNIDDPLLWGIMLKARHFWHASKMRWVLGAREICFTNPATSAFFTWGRVIPVDRGKGINQEAVDISIEKLRNGGWVHIFPEGRVNQSDQLLPFRWGAARMLLEATLPGHKAPLVIPFIHKGMDQIIPLASAVAGDSSGRIVTNPVKGEKVQNNGKPAPLIERWRYIMRNVPRFGKPIRVLVGPPIDVTHIIENSRNKSGAQTPKIAYNSLYSEKKTYLDEQQTLMAITAHIEEGFKKIYDQLHKKNIQNKPEV